MPRAIPLALLDHLAGPVTSTCYLLRIEPVTPGYAAYGVTSLDRNVVFSDVDGELTYYAAVGVQPSALQGGAALAVDNATGAGLLPEYDLPFLSEADIRAGVYDFARFRLYLVNYEDLTMGAALLRAGTIGRVTIDDDGLSTVTELRGLSAELKQSICQKDSLTCRATFGSQRAGSLTPGPVEMFPCEVDATALLIDGEVTAVGLENTVEFTVGGFTLDADALNPGMVFWVTGDNAGRANEIDTNTDAGIITLAHETDWPIAVGDTLQYRIDCNKQARDAAKGCKSAERWGDEWVLHFRGEPDIPIGDAGAMETPGASSAPGQGGMTQVPFTTEAE